MMTIRTRLIAVIALALPLAAMAAEPAHHHDAGTGQALQLNAGKKWTTDDTLRNAMTSIRTSTAAALPAAHAGKMSVAQYKAFGKELNAQIAHIVQNCKLDPQADAQLHIVLGGMIEGIDAVEGKTKADGSERAHGVLKIAQALDQYGEYFDHAGWQPVTPAH